MENDVFMSHNVHRASERNKLVSTWVRVSQRATSDRDCFVRKKSLLINSGKRES